MEQGMQEKKRNNLCPAIPAMQVEPFSGYLVFSLSACLRCLPG